MSSIDNS